MPANVQEFLKTDKVCALLWIHYLIDMFPTKRRLYDSASIFRYFKLLPELVDKARGSFSALDLSNVSAGSTRPMDASAHPSAHPFHFLWSYHRR